MVCICIPQTALRCPCSAWLGRITAASPVAGRARGAALGILAREGLGQLSGVMMGGQQWRGGFGPSSSWEGVTPWRSKSGRRTGSPWPLWGTCVSASGSCAPPVAFGDPKTWYVNLGGVGGQVDALGLSSRRGVLRWPLLPAPCSFHCAMIWQSAGGSLRSSKFALEQWGDALAAPPS